MGIATGMGMGTANTGARPRRAREETDRDKTRQDKTAKQRFAFHLAGNYDHHQQQQQQSQQQQQQHNIASLRNDRQPAACFKNIFVGHARLLIITLSCRVQAVTVAGAATNQRAPNN
jgi:hypothetical protein